MYEFALERGWDQTPTNLDKWFQQYALGRYGQENDFIKKAWHLLRVSKKNLNEEFIFFLHYWDGPLKNFLQRSVYSYHGLEAIRGKYIVCRRPSFKLSPTVGSN